MKEPKSVMEAIKILYFMTFILGFAPFKYKQNHGHKLSIYGVSMTLISICVYAVNFVLVLIFYQTDTYKLRVSAMTYISNVLCSILGFITVLALYYFAIAQYMKRLRIWFKMLKMDKNISSLGLSVSYVKLRNFTNSDLLFIIGTLLLVQTYECVVEGLKFGKLGAIYGIQKTLPLILTCTIISQTKGLMYIFAERLDLVNNYLKKILKNQCVPYVHLKQYYTKSRQKENIDIEKSNLIMIKSKQKEAELKLQKIIKLFLDICEWVGLMKLSYSVPIFLCTLLLFVNNVFKLHYAIILIYELLIEINYIQMSNLVIASILQIITHIALLVLLQLIESGKRKVKSLLHIALQLFVI